MFSQLSLSRSRSPINDGISVYYQTFPGGICRGCNLGYTTVHEGKTRFSLCEGTILTYAFFLCFRLLLEQLAIGWVCTTRFIPWVSLPTDATREMMSQTLQVKRWLREVVRFWLQTLVPCRRDVIPLKTVSAVPFSRNPSHPVHDSQNGGLPFHLQSWTTPAIAVNPILVGMALRQVNSLE